MKKRNYLIIVGLFFVAGLLLRCFYLLHGSLIFGFDQIMDVIGASRIVLNHDLIVRALQPNSQGLNHGVLFSYFMAIPIFFGRGNPATIACWYALFNGLGALAVFAVSSLLFKSRFLAFASLLLMTFSYRTILMSGWISNTTLAILLVPLLVLGFYLYKNGKKWGLIFTSFVAGLLIQSQLLMVYYLLTIPFVWIIYRLKRPDLKTAILSLFFFLLAMVTIIGAEFKSGFSTIKVFLHPSGSLNEATVPLGKSFLLFVKGVLDSFGLNLFPQWPGFGVGVGLLIVTVVVYFVIKKKTSKEERQHLLVLLLLFFSPVFTLIIGYHDTPWTLMGTIPLIFIFAGYALSKIKPLWIKMVILGFILLCNIVAFRNGYQKGELFIKQEASSTLKGQLAVVDYTYREADGKPFAINAVSYPLYTNTYWSYHYPWYGFRKYGYLPNWSGGVQEYPFNTLPMSDGKEQVYFMIIDETKAIPLWDKTAGKVWGQKFGKLVKEETIGGFTVQKFIK